MKDILFMTFLGLIAGMISIFWTRIIRTNMIFRSVGKWLERKNNSYLVNYNRDSLWVKLLRCTYCITPWIVGVLELIYIIVFAPNWIFAGIGMFGGLGAGNLICEIVHSFRYES
jgi:hypothetical protein